MLNSVCDTDLVTQSSVDSGDLELDEELGSLESRQKDGGVRLRLK